MADAAEPNMPVCLISQEGTGEGSSLVIHEEGLAVLRALGTTPVATVAVAGMYRTGKSFFLNQLFPGQSGFVVGNTTTSCTRGIWVWVAPPGVWDSPSGARLLVLDTEGLSSFDQDETYDAKIFSLAILLSSFFVYNSMGVIDESAIDRLFLVGELTKNISLSTVKSRREAEADGEAGGAAEAGGEPAGDGDGEGEGEGEEAEVSEADLAQFFPPFLWILRDFSLKLKDGEGRDISLHQYLETALEDRKGSGRRVEDGNRIRQSFRTLFKERECFTLIRPVHEEDQLMKLSELPVSELRPEFKAGMDTARGKILGRVAPKTVFEETVTGAGLAMLAKSYVEAINTGAVPDIRKSWDYVVEETLRLAYEAASQNFKQGLGGFCKEAVAEGAKIPDREAITAKVQEEVASADKVFVDKGGAMAKPELPGSWKLKLSTECDALADRALGSLVAKSQEVCTTLADKLLDEKLRKPVAEGAFDDADAAAFEEVVRGVLSEYDEAGSGPSKAGVSASALQGRPLLDVVGSLLRRLSQQAAAKLASCEAELRAEQEAKAGLESVLEQKQLLVQQLETAKAETEAELSRTRESLSNTEAELGSTRDELHTTQRAKDVLESELGEARRLHEQEVERSAAARAEAEERLEAQRKDAEAKAAMAQASHEEVLRSRDDQIAQLNSSVERERESAKEATARHEAQVASLEGEKEALNTRIAGVEEARESERQAAADAAQQASAQQMELQQQLVERQGELQLSAAEKAALQKELEQAQRLAETTAVATAEKDEQMRRQLEDVQQSLAQQQQAASASADEHAAAQHRLEETAAEMQRKLDAAAAEADKSGEMHRLELENARGNQAIAQQEAEARAAAAAEEISRLKTANEEAATQIDAFGADLAAKMTELAASQKEAAALQADAERLELELKTTLEKNLAEVNSLNEEIATEGIRREKLEELIDRMHAFQNTEIESSNALKLELKAQRDAEDSKWHNVLKQRTAEAAGVTAEVSGSALKLGMKSMKGWRKKAAAAAGMSEDASTEGAVRAAFGAEGGAADADAEAAALAARRERLAKQTAELSSAGQEAVSTMKGSTPPRPDETAMHAQDTPEGAKAPPALPGTGARE